MKLSEEITAAHWSKNVACSDAFSPEVYWLAVPAVQKRFQRLACGKSHHGWWIKYCLEEFLKSSASPVRMLSVGCGSGSLERDLFQLNAFSQCDAIDIAPGALEIARFEAGKLGASNINYSLKDAQKNSLGNGLYDAVWFNGSLHHIKQLEFVCEAVRLALKPGGWVFYNEYVGANHFDFSTPQREAIHGSFMLLPQEYRRSFHPEHFGSVQHSLRLPEPAEVIKVDPSEAVRSQDIRRVLARYFQECAFNPCGGNILQFVLHGIAGNFVEADPRSMVLLQMLFNIEDTLIENGFLSTDFAVGASRLP